MDFGKILDSKSYDQAHICVELPRTGIYPISRLKTRDTQQLLEKNLDNESSCFFLFFSCS